MMDESDDEEEVGYTLDMEVDEENWENIIQMQVNEMSCLAGVEGLQRPGRHHNGRRTSSFLVYPIVAYDDERCPYPLVLGLVLTGLRGRTVIYEIDREELPIGLADYMTELLEFEGMPTSIDWNPTDVFIEAKVATILLPEDILFARENGWHELMQQVRSGARTTHRLAVEKMGRMALADKKQRKAYKELKKENLDDEERGQG